MRVPAKNVSPEAVPPSRVAWRQRAACRGFDPNVFVPSVEKRDQVAEAVGICAGCEARTECLAEGLADPRLVGVWGGLTTRERQELRTAQRRATAHHGRLSNTKITTATAPIASVTTATVHASPPLTSPPRGEP
jgi:WhiB family redox-sensing transcriptional regulator